MGREGHCRQISLVCVGSTRSVPATLGFPLLVCVCFPHLHCSGSSLLYREQTLSCVHFPSLSRSDSCSWVLHKGRLSGACVFCLPCRSSSDNQELDERTLPRCSPRYSLHGPSLTFRVHWSGVPCVSSGELISGCDPPSRCQPSRISGSLWLETGSLFAVW